jgi:hypothetical protein
LVDDRLRFPDAPRRLRCASLRRRLIGHPVNTINRIIHERALSFDSGLPYRSSIEAVVRVLSRDDFAFGEERDA